jgi:hypothetical protein
MIPPEHRPDSGATPNPACNESYALPTETPLLTIIPELGRLSLEASDGTVLLAPTKVTNYDMVDAFEITDFLATVHCARDGGPGSYTLLELAELSGRIPMRAHEVMRQMARLLPDIIRAEGEAELARAKVSEDFGRMTRSTLQTFSTIRLDAVRIAGRKPNQDELGERAKQKALLSNKHTEYRQGYRAALIEAEAHKTDLTKQDHAIITVRDQQYRLPLGSVPAIVAGRLLEALTMPTVYVRRDEIKEPRLRRQIWDLMSLDERRLFSDKDSIIHGSTTPAEVIAEMKRTLTKLTPQLGITERIGSVHCRMVRPHDLRVSYHAEPPAPSEDTVAPVLYAPDTPEYLLQGPADGTAPDADTMAFAELTLESLRTTTRISHQDAIDILDFTMSTQGKHALLQTLTQDGQRDKYKTTLEGIHTMLYRSLGGGSYWLALRERMIKGYGSKGSQGSIKQVSGGLPTTTRWHIGVMSDQEKSWQDRFDSK